MADYEQKSITELLPDEHNANLGTLRGKELLRTSLAERGAARSIVIDRDGRIIAGNKTVEQAKAAGITNVIVVPTSGESLVAVQRNDLSLLDDPDYRARMVAYDDNVSSEKNLLWDAEVVSADYAEIPLSAHFTEEELSKLSVQMKEDTSFFEGVLNESSGGKSLSDLDPAWDDLEDTGNGSSPAAADFVQMIFVVTPTQRDAIFAAINRARREHNLETQGAALVFLLGLAETGQVEG